MLDFCGFGSYINKCRYVRAVSILQIAFDNGYKVIDDDILPGVFLVYFENVNALLVYILVLKYFTKQLLVVFYRVHSCNYKLLTIAALLPCYRDLRYPTSLPATVEVFRNSLRTVKHNKLMVRKYLSQSFPLNLFASLRLSLRGPGVKRKQ